MFLLLPEQEEEEEEEEVVVVEAVEVQLLPLVTISFNKRFDLAAEGFVRGGLEHFLFKFEEVLL